MSALPQKTPLLTEAEYLVFERTSELKHEFYAGEVFAMSGASRAHNLISGGAYVTLYNQLRGRPCEVYSSDMRVKVAAAGMYTYPDISVVCGVAQFSDEHIDTLLNPTIIIEVLSPSTERYDRGRKFKHYRELDALREYVLIAQDSPHVEDYLRLENGLWQFAEAKGLNAVLELASIGCALALADIYERVTFGAADDDAPGG